MSELQVVNDMYNARTTSDQFPIWKFPFLKIEITGSELVVRVRESDLLDTIVNFEDGRLSNAYNSTFPVVCVCVFFYNFRKLFIVEALDSARQSALFKNFDWL